MTYTITKEFAFSASHVLHGLPRGHQCGRLHGHNYVVKVELTGDQLLDVGFLFDYGDLKPVKEFIDGTLDHQHLNDTFEDVNPTAEAMAFVLARMTAELLDLPEGVSVAVGVSETPKTWAWWRP